MPQNPPKLLLIDGSHALFRAYYAVRGLAAPDGRPMGALYGFTAMVLKLLREQAPDRMAVCFDVGATFREDLDVNYKANRAETPEDLKLQWPLAIRVTRELGVPALHEPGFEADDLIAGLAESACEVGYEVTIVSGDKDLMQLVVDRCPNGLGGCIRQLDDGKGTVYDEKGVLAKWGVPPERVGDLLAIMGDSSDNIPGVPGIGEKGAVKLLQDWGSFDAIYANLDHVQPQRAQDLLRAGEASARLARQLVTLRTDARPPFTADQLSRQPEHRPTLAGSFAEFGFKRLLREYVDEPPTAQAQTRCEALLDLKQIEKLVQELRAAGRFALAVATTDGDANRSAPMTGELAGVALCSTPDRAFYIPIRHAWMLGEALPPSWTSVREMLRPLLEDAAIAKVGHDTKYDGLVLRRHGLQVAGWTADAMLASYLIEPERYAHTLQNIAFNHLGTTFPPEADVLGKVARAGGRGSKAAAWADLAIEAAAAHLAQRAALSLRAVDLLQPKLDELGLRPLHDDLEIPLSAALAELEWRGVLVDPAELGRQSEWLGGEVAAEEAAIFGMAGGPFNVQSPSQLGEILFGKLGLPAKKKTQSGWSTDQSVLEGLAEDHPIAARVLRFRQLSKLKSTYTDSLPGMIDSRTGRIHTCFNQAVAATGRLSSTDPNLQNIPIRSVEGRRIRRAFIAAQGCVLLSADYSQVELRIMAHMAHEPGMLDAFRRGLDIHRQTAADIFGVFPDLVTPQQRSAAKTINFGILYGMGPQRLARSIDVSVKEAKAFIERYFERFPGVKAFVETTLEEARRTGEVRTLFGRRRPLPDLASSNQMARAAAERVAVNTPVQGTAADIIKRAMLEVERQLTAHELKATLLLQVHDELVLEVPHAEVEAVTALVRMAMQGAAELAVPLHVDVGVGANWSDAH
jgi:DNA polymerase-1